jgi:hypothetical protein
VKDLYNENLKQLKNKIQEDKDERSPMLMDWQINIVKMAIIIKTMYMFNAIPIEIQWHS